jgi:S-adenosylmethionine hydrolase
MAGLITFTTDFGTRDWFVGTMKGVVLGISRKTTIVDLTHEVEAGDIRAGAFALAASYHFFPKGTVHVAVVDPGVGSKRQAIAVQTARYYFVGPDNGVLSWALARERIKAIRLIEKDTYFLRPVSQTFHGRDVFAPVAAHLSRGVPIHKFGPGCKNFMGLAWPAPWQTPHGVQGEIVYIDRFGNALTNLNSPVLASLGGAELRVFSAGKRLCPVVASYSAVPPGAFVAVLSSSGFLEIAINGGSAAGRLKLRVGQKVTVKPA